MPTAMSLILSGFTIRNQQVAGSIPAGGSRFFKQLAFTPRQTRIQVGVLGFASARSYKRALEGILESAGNTPEIKRGGDEGFRETYRTKGRLRKTGSSDGQNGIFRARLLQSSTRSSAQIKINASTISRIGASSACRGLPEFETVHRPGARRLRRRDHPIGLPERFENRCAVRAAGSRQR